MQKLEKCVGRWERNDVNRTESPQDLNIFINVAPKLFGQINLGNLCFSHVVIKSWNLFCQTVKVYPLLNYKYYGCKTFKSGAFLRQSRSSVGGWRGIKVKFVESRSWFDSHICVPSKESKFKYVREHSFSIPINSYMIYNPASIVCSGRGRCRIL